MKKKNKIISTTLTILFLTMIANFLMDNIFPSSSYLQGEEECLWQNKNTPQWKIKS